MPIFNSKKRLNELKQNIEQLSVQVAQLKVENSATQAILGSMIEGVIAVDKDTKIISINPAIEEIFKVKKEEAEGRFLLEAIRNNDIAELINLCLQNKALISKELILVWPVQSIFQVNASPLFENDAVSGCVVVIHDITEIRRLERMRSDFVANVSHELKTPLTSIKGFVETLLEGALEDKENSRNFLSIIQDQAERLNNLINDLLELSHIESKEVSLKLGDLYLCKLFEAVVFGFKSKIKKKNIEIKNELADTAIIKADKEKIEQVVINLIDNAIKFNKENGSIRIFSEDSGDRIKIIVEDSGAGIPEKDIPRIFERFYRVDKARSRELGGTGLGLSIVKNIIELHGGSVGVESTEGLGTKLFFLLPKDY
ncbi:MAG: ATP-binding protein [Candidatus Omnitrophota bacterium]